MKRASLCASSSMELIRSARFSALSESPNFCSVVIAPVIPASGVRRSCESEASKVARSFSFSSNVAVRRESFTSIARSTAIAVWSRIRLSPWSSAGPRAASRAAGSNPQTPTTPRDVVSGRN